MNSFHGDSEFKQKYIDRVVAHKNADAIVQGRYWEEGKGCAVGCTFELSDNVHEAGAKEWDVPEWLLRLEDTIFEGLPNDKAVNFPLQIIEAIPVGKSEDFFNQIKWKFSAFLLKENIDRVLDLDIEETLKKQIVESIRSVLNLYELALETSREWSESARSAAWSAADSASRSAAESASWSARSAAESAAYIRYRDELLKLLAETN